MTSRIGVYGGMFDPVHRGHLEAASYAVSQLNLDQLRLVPCSIPNHRDPASASSEQRVQMLELAIRGTDRIIVDQREINRDGVSYTVETLKSLRQEYSEAQLVMVLGLDSFNSLLQWHLWHDLFDYVHLFVLNRSGGELLPEVLNKIEYENRAVDRPGRLFNQHHGAIYFARDFNFDVSSTQVRKAVIAKEKLDHLLSADVESYIEANQLYR
jgi:nicotinate-nucleotide adenylyltransferase